MGAVLRNVTFTEASYESFIDLQDKLHQNLARQRTLSSIGTHDLDTVKGPFRYVARKPEEIKFVALKQEKEMSAPELLEMYEKDSFMKQYVPIIKNKERYPLILDSNSTICSLPPIINGEHSKITLSTKNVFIEVTGTDWAKTNIVLDTIVTMFSEYCAAPFKIEPVEIEYFNGKKEITPTLKYENEKIISRIPPTRHDILHPCDIMEDVAVAYDFNKLVMTMPPTNTVAKQLPINKLCDLLRVDVAAAGFCEALTFALVSRADLGEKMGFDKLPAEAVTVSNPKTAEFQVCRTGLLPGLLKTTQANRKLPLPLKLFEISDVVLKDDSTHTGCRNERHMSALCYSNSSGFEVIHGLLDRVMELLEAPPCEPGSADGYYIKKGSSPTYFQVCADIYLWNEKIGQMGVIHPNTLKAFELPNPVSAFEINLEPFL
ncbi:Oidioi.mRNA.OKI2018_I69.chr1.g2358.t1.cds [Oikopleura dioica]|uniref:phenylalanine--tRNA ligase n=1 Tax=Oikopleura dioica TaxID=34765 RepID=A0ABN7SQW2_OIKDI|nr:Oidioi.mRNA.OKI2018_I69.chr1.g2358.t1.cds [Oikopleura dioica]